MTRELKFRAWIHAYCGGGVPQKCFNTMAYGTDDSLEDFFSQFENFFDIMQYTGLKDKNGKEIYEGDILKEDDAKTPVIVVIGEFVHEENYGDKATFYGCNVPIRYGYKDYFDYKYEIIGNIHENPELL